MNEPQHILVVEDEPKIAQLLVDFLNVEGYHLQVLHDGLNAVSFIRENQPDLAILDVMLPNKDGLTICKEVRQFSNMPILMLTARVDEIDRLMGLGFGADDYVCKPFSPREVVARVQAILRRTQAAINTPNEEQVHFKQVHLNLERFQCHVGEQLVDLTPVEFRLLLTLIKRPGKVHSRDSLMLTCYEDDRIVSHRTIDSHMKNLRSKLTKVLPTVPIVHSVYGIGYKAE